MDGHADGRTEYLKQLRQTALIKHISYFYIKISKSMTSTLGSPKETELLLGKTLDH